MSLAPFPAQLGPLTVRRRLVRTESTKSGLGNEPTRKEQAAVQVALIPAHLPIFQLLAGMHPSSSHKVPRNDSGRLLKSPRTPWLQLQLFRKQIAIKGCIPINRCNTYWTENRYMYMYTTVVYRYIRDIKFCVLTSSVFTVHHAGATRGEELTPSGCCSLRECGHLPAACRQR